MAALPPQPPGSLPPEPPGFSPAVGPPPVAPPQGPYSPGNAYAGQMPAQPYMSQPMPQPVVVKVHKRTFWLTIAQIIIIFRAVLILLAAIGLIVLGVFVLAQGHSFLSTLPFYDQARRQLSIAVLNGAVYVFTFVPAVFLFIVGIVDIVLGVTVGRPSNAARWIIVVLDVLTALGLLGSIGRAQSAFVIVLIVFLALKVIVLYAMVVDPATRRNFAGKAM